MKHLKLLIAAMFMAISLGLPAKAVFAASTLTQSDFDALDCNTHNIVNGITCYDLYGAGNANTYLLSPGEYTLGSDLNLDGVLSNLGNLTLNLNGHNISSIDDYATLYLGAGTVVINGSGTVTNAGDTTIYMENQVFDTNTGYWTDSAELGNLTINGGTFVNTAGSNAGYFASTNVTINGGAFQTSGASNDYGSAIEFADYTARVDNIANLTINGGTFTSTNDRAALVYGAKSVTITGGTFTGSMAGLALAGNKDVSLSGGTFNYTGTAPATATSELPYGAITIYGAESSSAITDILAAGYAYTDPTSGTVNIEDPSGETIYHVYLSGRSVSVYLPSSEDPTDDSSDDTAESSSETTTTTAVAAPNSGHSTAESSAAVSLLSTAAAATLSAGAIVAARRFAKK